jgi:ABC-type transport system substrate-binding protein/DNA-binding SARP family transcriptional activator
MDLQLLGPVEATVQGRPIPLGATKQRALLAILALHANSTVSIDFLVDALWGEEPPATAPKMVQIYVSQLRRLFDGNRAEIVTHGRGYELRLDADSVDSLRFERAVEAAGHGNGTLARDALALWRGDALANVAGEPFAPGEIRRLEELRLRATELAIEADLAAGRHREVLGELEALVTAHPLSERLHGQRMLALYRSGRQAEALEAYRHARQVLVEEIGVEPGPELRALHDAILRQDGEALDPPRVRPRPPPAPPTDDTAPAPSRRTRWLVLAAALAVVAGAAVFAVTRLTSQDSLPRIDENYVGLIDSDGHITHEYAVGRSPGAVATGADSVWVANTLDRTVSRVKNGGGEVVSIPIGGTPTALAFGAGSLWAADGDSGNVLQIDPGSNTVGERIDVGNAPRALTAGYGALWAGSAADSTVRRIDLRTGARRTIPLGGSATAIAAGAGAVWVASEETGTVTRIEPSSGSVGEPIPVGHGASAVAVGEGAVWVASRDGTVSRIDPTSSAVSWTVPIGGDPVAVVAADGAVWVATDAAATVSRVDPRAPRVLTRVKVGGSPAGLAVAGGRAWVATGAPRSSHRGGTLRILWPAPDFGDHTIGIDWVDTGNYGGLTAVVDPLAYDGLVAYRRVGGTAGLTLVGALATRAPAPSDDGLTYVFTLRPGLRYSDGRAVRPEDFRASMERFLQVTRTEDVGEVFAGIVGAQRCMRSSARCDLSEGIESDPRARTITVHLRRPDSDFLPKLTQSAAFVVPAGTARRHVGDRLPPGTGPYRVAAWDSRSGGHLVRNRYFRGRPDRPAGFADRVEFRAVSLESTPAQVPKITQGAADFLTLVDGAVVPYPPAQLSTLAARAPGQVQSGPFPALTFMFLNVRRAPFDHIDVRRALNYATDRRRIAEFDGGVDIAPPTCQILPPSFPGYARHCRYTTHPGPGHLWEAPDLERARGLIARSGTAGERVVVRVPEFRRRVGRYFERLLDELGYRAALRVIPNLEYSYGDPALSWQMGFMGWGLDYVGASNFIQPHFDCGAGGSHFCNRRYTRQVRAALAARGAAAGERWAAIDRLLSDLAPFVPLTNARRVFIVSKRVGNVQTNPQGPLLDQMWVK